MKPMLPEFGQCGELFHTPSGTAFADIPLKTTGKPSPYAAPIRSSAERARGLPGRLVMARRNQLLNRLLHMG